MPKLSPVRAGVMLFPGLPLLRRGKVRDSYDLGGGKRLMVATDGISIFDFVLNALVKEKGSILSALSHFWFTHLKGFGIGSHLITAGASIDEHLPEALRGNLDLQSRAMVARELTMTPVEFVARGYLTGSGLEAYERNGSVLDHVLPCGLEDGDELPYLLDTPTTKSEEGHDVSLFPRAVREQYPEASRLLLVIFQIAASHARRHRIILADTKLEFGVSREGELLVGDELITPDSSRFWDAREWEESQKSANGRKAPPALDKQLVRAWGKERGINDRKPEKPEDVAAVHLEEVPPSLLGAATASYRYLFWRLTGKTREAYLDDTLGVRLPRPKKKIAIVLGSVSDAETAYAAYWRAGNHGSVNLKRDAEWIHTHVVSCHRNPEELRSFASDNCGGADVVVAAGGKALALPGILSALIQASGKHIPVVGVALGTPGTPAFEAARLSIEELPGTPVVMNEVTGKAYCGVEGLAQAIERIVTGELPPPRLHTTKPAQFNVELLKLVQRL